MITVSKKHHKYQLLKSSKLESRKHGRMFVMWFWWNWQSDVWET